MAFECQHCAASFLQLSTLQRHLSKAHPEAPRKFRCPRCPATGSKMGKTEWTTKQLLRHLRSHNPAEKLLGCRLCGTGYCLEGSLRQHAKKCDGSGVPRRLPRASQALAAPGALEAEAPVVSITVDPAAEGLALRCTRCRRTFTHAEFSEHACPARTDAGQDARPAPRLMCARCQATFVTRGRARRHLAACRAARTLLRPSGSSRRAGRRKGDAMVVAETDLSDREQQYLVESEPREEFHVAEEEEGESEDEGVEGVEDDMDLIELAEEGEGGVEEIESDKRLVPDPMTFTARIPCSYCDRTFKTKYHLNEHEMQHTGNFPVHCDHCGRGFRRK